MNIQRKPEWLQKKVNSSEQSAMLKLLATLNLNTVCQQALCPNISECFKAGQATFLVLGTACTRLCSFCNVDKSKPLAPDDDEPARVAEAVSMLKLAHVVITSPTRDDLADGGASVYAETVAAIKKRLHDTKVELLIPDFMGNQKSLETVVNAMPDIIGHNLETVPRLYHIRSGSDYKRSLAVLDACKKLAPQIYIKSGIMLGMGELENEVVELFQDLIKVGCDYLSIGQYLAPSKRHYPVQEYLTPEQFDRFQKLAVEIGFKHVESAPYVRSSYHAADYK